jgi:hypothetical protein
MSGRRVALAAVLIVALAGCGGSGSTTTSSISPASYRATVNKICAAYNASVRALPKKTTGSIQGLTTLASSAKNALSQVRSVAPPSSMASAVAKWTALLEQSEAAVAKLLDAFRSGDTTALRAAAAQGTKLNQQANAHAQALGLPSCAENATPSGA